jgi:hypothetical protein
LRRGNALLKSSRFFLKKPLGDSYENSKDKDQNRTREETGIVISLVDRKFKA